MFSNVCRTTKSAILVPMSCSLTTSVHLEGCKLSSNMLMKEEEVLGDIPPTYSGKDKASGAPEDDDEEEEEEKGGGRKGRWFVGG